VIGRAPDRAETTLPSVTPPQARPRILRGNVLWLSIVSLLTDFSSEMIYPLLPYFLTNVLRAGPAFLGTIEGIAETTASLLKLASGWLSDRIRRRKILVLVGYGLASVVRPLVAIAAAPWQVLAIRFADRFGKGIRGAPRDALIADSVDAAYRGTAFGYHRAADHLGAVLGPLTATALLFLMPGEYRLLFALAAIPALASFIVLWLKVREAGVPERTTPKVQFQGFGGLGKRFMWFLLVVFVFTLGNATDMFLLLRAQELGVPLALIPFLWAAFHVSKMLWNVVGGRLADRIGPRPAIIAGWLVYALTYAGFAAANAAWQVWALFGIYGLFYGLTEAPEKALVAAMAPSDRRGAAFGAYHFAIGIGALPASAIFGLIWQQYGHVAAFGLGGALALIASVSLALLPIRGDH
jgi:MFS family permease